MSPSNKRWLRRILIVALSVVAVEQLWRHTHDYIWPDKLAAVEPGKIYRGAWQQDYPMRNLIRDKKIKTIVALAHPPDHPLVKREQALARELGCRWVHVPIVDERSLRSEKSLFDKLEEAASWIADPSNQPVYFHCHHGINRASMVQMAYRMLYCNWSLEQATQEIARTFGLREVDKGPDYRHMKGFYERRVLPRRTSGEPASLARGSAAAVH